MNVLSLFDGISCGRVALERAGIKVDNYYASEIDPHALIVSKRNWPGTVQLGDVSNVRYEDGVLYSDNGNFFVGDIDLILAGSPCQGFSFAGKQLAFDDERSKLYFEFERILEEVRPKNFLLENVRMKQEHKDVITDRLGVQPIAINSNLVSAQNRYRLYWTNIEGVKQPEDRGIMLEDVILNVVPEALHHSKTARDYMSAEVKGGRLRWAMGFHSDTELGKSSCITANTHKGVPNNVLIDRRDATCFRYECDFQGDQDSCKGCVDGDNYRENGVVNSVIRKFDPVECERLQTLPDGYTAGVATTHRLKAIGNGWTVDVITHILQNVVPKPAPRRAVVAGKVAQITEEVV
jgi:DNA-cytosine methyltransferase